MSVRRIVHQMRHMVIQDEAVEADFAEFLHDRDDIAVALVYKALLEIVGAALHIAQMDIEESSACPEPLDGIQNALAAPHLRPAPMTEIQAVHRTRMRLHRASK